MPIRCSGRPTRSLAMVAYVDDRLWKVELIMTRNILSGLFAAIVVAAGLSFSNPSRATQLITEEQANLPPTKGAVAADRRGILRGPKVEFVSPGDGVASPLRLQLQFESFGGAKIDPAS